ncbi:hypothetical protein H0H93_012643 [Arthromyces matolae]|nr:hypothetical protein H0H93_012643 [Arthromyces matolae]
MSSGSGLPPLEHATFAVNSRLISCLVTENLLRGLYISFNTFPSVAGILVVLSKHLVSEPPVLNRALGARDVYAVVPLRNAPVFAPIDEADLQMHKHGRPVGLVDPLDMLPQIYEFRNEAAECVEDPLCDAIHSCFVSPPWEMGPSATLTRIKDVVHLWQKFVDGIIMQHGLREAIHKEIQSSYDYQLLSYQNPPSCPSLTSPPIEWEQSLVAGHPTHPMYRARSLPSALMENYDWYHPRIRFVLVPRNSLRVLGQFEDVIGPQSRRDARSMEVVPKLDFDPRILSISREPASAVYRSEDPELAKHFTAILREEIRPERNQAVIVSAALLEMDHAGLPSGTSAVESVFKLDTYEKRAKFLDRQALIPPLINNGVAFEAHAQNVLVRIDISTCEPIGFVIRDLGGLRIHPDTLCLSTGVDFKFLPGHCVAVASLDEIYPKFYHTFVHNHIQRLIRVLGMHTNGHGWEMLREHMGAAIPEHHELRKIWLAPDSKLLPSKCLMRMRMRDSYREMVYTPIPNMIQYRPEKMKIITRSDLFARSDGALPSDNCFHNLQAVYAFIDIKAKGSTQAGLNGVTKKTKVVIKGGQHPEWDEELRFTVVKQSLDKSRKLEVACFAKEHKSDDLLGKGEVDITETLKTGEFDDWVPLNVDGVVRGDLYLEMTFFSNAPVPAASSSVAPSTRLLPPGDFQRRPPKLEANERLSRPPHASPQTRVQQAQTRHPAHRTSGTQQLGSHQATNQLNSRPNQSSTSDRITRTPALHNLLSDPVTGKQAANSTGHHLQASPASSRSSSASPLRNTDSPLPPLPYEAPTSSSNIALPSTLLPGGGRHPPSQGSAHSSTLNPQLPATLRAGSGRVVSQPNPSSHIPAHERQSSTGSIGSINRQSEYTLVAGSPVYSSTPTLPLNLLAGNAQHNHYPPSISAPSTYSSLPQPISLTPRPETTSTGLFSFPVPMPHTFQAGPPLDSYGGSYGPPPSQASYDYIPQTSYPAAPPQTAYHIPPQQPSYPTSIPPRQSPLPEEFPDPYLQARYSTPLPLPPGQAPSGRQSACKPCN